MRRSWSPDADARAVEAGLAAGLDERQKRTWLAERLTVAKGPNRHPVLGLQTERRGLRSVVRPRENAVDVAVQDRGLAVKRDDDPIAAAGIAEGRRPDAVVLRQVGRAAHFREMRVEKDVSDERPRAEVFAAVNGQTGRPHERARHKIVGAVRSAADRRIGMKSAEQRLRFVRESPQRHHPRRQCNKHALHLSPFPYHATPKRSAISWPTVSYRQPEASGLSVSFTSSTKAVTVARFAMTVGST